MTEMAWQQHFVTNMFIRPKSHKEIEGFAPEFTIINACKVADADWKRHGLNSEVGWGGSCFVCLVIMAG